MKKVLALLMVIVVFGTMFAGCTSGKDSGTKNATTSGKPADTSIGSTSGGDTIKIGVLGNMGSVAISFFMPGALLAVEEANAAGGINGKKIELVTRDTAGNAANIHQKMTELKNEGCIAILGPDSDGQAPTAAIWCNQNKFPAVTVSTMSTQVALESHSEYFFTSGLNSWAIVKAIARDIKDKGYRTYAVVGTDGGATTDFINISKREFAKFDPPIELVTSVQVGTGTSDFNNILTAIKGKNVDFTMTALSATLWISYFEQAHMMGLYNGDRMNYGWEFVEALYTGSLKENYPSGHFRGALIYPYFLAETQEQIDFNQNLYRLGKEHFGADIDHCGQMMVWYIGTKAIIEAAKLITDNNYSGEAMRDALEQVEFSTPFHKSVKFRKMDHALIVPYYYTTAVWKDKDMTQIGGEDSYWIDAEEILPTYEEYKEYAKDNNIEMNW